MGVQTHVIEYSGDHASTIGAYAGPLQLTGPLRMLNGRDNWCVALYAIPPGKTYEDIAGRPTPEYLQAAGSAEAMVVEIRKPGGAPWGAQWVRYVVGHPHDDTPALDVAIPLPDTTEMISRSEIFDAEEAAELFITYHRTNDIPGQYSLRPVEGYTSDFDIIDLRDKAL